MLAGVAAQHSFCTLHLIRPRNREQHLQKYFLVILKLLIIFMDLLFRVYTTLNPRVLQFHEYGTMKLTSRVTLVPEVFFRRPLRFSSLRV